MDVTVAGLPAHPLVVHAVVVLLPLAALGAAAIAVRPRWNRPYAPLVALAAVGAAVAATVARETGEQLEVALALEGEVAELVAVHGRWGLYTVVASWPFAVLAVATAVLGRAGREPRRWPRLVAALTAVAGAVATVVTVLAGHSGATAVWGWVAG